MEHQEMPVCPEGLELKQTEEGLCLTDGDLELRGDYSRMTGRLKHHNLSGELLVKAAKIKGNAHPYVIDATAGLGEDSLLLAAAGCRVDLYEQDPVIAALLADTLMRAAAVPDLAEAVSRMHLHPEDSIGAMLRLAEELQGPDREQAGNLRPDVVVLDPMFPARSKSGMIGKKFQLLQRLEHPCTDEADLLAAALAVEPKKIIIKRPAKGPYLAGRKPSYSLQGKAIRYDCIVTV